MMGVAPQVMGVVYQLMASRFQVMGVASACHRRCVAGIRGIAPGHGVASRVIYVAPSMRRITRTVEADLQVGLSDRL